MTRFVNISAEPEKPSTRQVLEVMDILRNSLPETKSGNPITPGDLVLACLCECMAKLRAEHEDAEIQAVLDDEAPPWLYRELQRVCTFMEVPKSDDK